MEDGAVQASEEGTPQGGLVSPVLANIYLHYVLDMWFEKRFALRCRGKAFLIRYCDDFIACFQSEEDARRFLVELRERLADFALEVEPSKTGLVRFGSAAPWNCKRDGLRRPQTFDFLGFTHYVHRSHRGYFVVGRRTERKRFKRKLQELNERLRALRVRGGTAMLCYFQQHMRGHIQYYGVSGNYRQLAAYAYFASRLLYKWLNRRSQRRQRLGSVFGRRCIVVGCHRCVSATLCIPYRRGRLRLGAEWCNAPCSVLRGRWDVPTTGIPTTTLQIGTLRCVGAGSG